MLAAIGTNIGKGIARRLKPAKRTSGRLGNDQGLETGILLVTLASARGWSGVSKFSELRPFWLKTKRQGDLVGHRVLVVKGIKKWAATTGMEIDTGVYYWDKTLKDMVQGIVVPGAAVAEYDTAEHGWSILSNDWE